MQSKKHKLIDNEDLKEEHLGQKKLYLNEKGNAILANNFLSYLSSNFWNNSSDSNCLRINDVE